MNDIYIIIKTLFAEPKWMITMLGELEGEEEYACGRVWDAGRRQKRAEPSSSTAGSPQIAPNMAHMKNNSTGVVFRNVKVNTDRNSSELKVLPLGNRKQVRRDWLETCCFFCFFFFSLRVW